MREDILGALKSALIRGETLKRAMMTLYNAGYKKNEIEESAAALQQIIQQQKPVAQAKPLQPIQQPALQQQPIAKLQPKTIQRVSGYGQTSTKLPPNFEKPSSKIKIILIILSLIILIGILVGAFLFSSELIEILNSAFN